MEHTFIPQLYGVIKNPNRRLIPENKAFDALNVEFSEGKFMRRKGYAAMGTNLPLSGPVTAISWFEDLGTSNLYLYLFTTRDSYYYNTTYDKWYYLTKQYNTGTVYGSGTSLTGVGTTWDNTNWSKIGVYEIKFGTNDANVESITKTGNTNTSTSITGLSNVTDLFVGMTITGTDIPTGTTVASIASASSITISQAATGTHSGITFTFGLNTWYTVNTVTGATAITLDDTMPTISVTYAVKYILRLCWSGDIDDRHSVCQPIDGDLKKIMVTNGVDDIQYTTGTNPFQNVGGTPNKAKYIAYFGSVTQERVYSAWTIDTGVNQPQTIEMAEIGNIDDWSSGTYYDLYNSMDQITGIKQLSDNIVIYKENSISLAHPNDNDIDPLSVRQNISTVGTPAIDTVIDYGRYHIFMGNDFKVYLFDGINMQDISQEIYLDLVSKINMGKVNRSIALDLRFDNLYCLAIPTENDYPDRMYVLNINEKTWSIWGFKHLITAFGSYKVDASYTWQLLYNTGMTWKDLYDAGLTWNDLTVVSGNKYYLIGDSEGNVYTYGGSSNDDNGYEISSTLETRDYSFNELKHAKKIMEIIVGCEPGTGTIQVACSTDFGATWSDWITIVFSGTTDYVERVGNLIRVGKQMRFKFRNVSGSYYEIESILAGWEPYGITVGR